MKENLLQKIIRERQEKKELLEELIDFPLYYNIDDSDITIDYYDGLDMKNTFDMDNSYKNMNNLTSLENDVVHIIVRYIKADPDIFFASQVEKIVLNLKNKPLVIFSNNNPACDRTTLINLDKILEDKTPKFNFLRNNGINFKKLTAFGLGLITVSFLIYKFKK